ncbi:MAG: DUF5719 family protein [Candidatus Geothermincolia bacterium]
MVKSAWKKVGKGTLVSMIAGLVAILMALLPLSTAQAAPAITWSKTRSGMIDSNIRDNFFMPNATEGWAVGSFYFDGGGLYHCWHTTNTGVSWQAQTIGDWEGIPALMRAEMESVYFRGSNLGWTCGQWGIVSRCTNSTGAGTWQVTRTTTESEVLQDIFATSDSDVWAVGKTVGATDSPLVVKSNDGGLTWHYVDLEGVSFTDSANGWAVGPAGTIIHTSNGGTSWAFQVGGTTADLNAVYAVSATEAWAAGASGTILHTTDGGTTWTSDFGANAVFSLDATHTWVGGQGGLIMFYDGDGWTKQDGGTTANIKSIRFLNATYGWACGDSSLNLYTTDGGTTWNAGPVPGAPSDFNDIALYDDTGGSGNYLIWVCGQGGRFYYTTQVPPAVPAGWSGASVTPPPVQDLKGIDFRDAANGVVTGSSGTAAYTVDGGDTWTNSTTVGATEFTDVTYGHSADFWIATAEDGGLWLTRDADGGLWAPMTLNDVCNAGVEGTEYYAGNGGTILKRVGATWTVRDAGTGRDIKAIKYAGSTQQFWAAGADDTVLWSDDEGATWNSIPTGIGSDWTDMSVTQAGPTTFQVTVVGNDGNIATTTMENPPSGLVVWTAGTTPAGAPDLRSVCFFNKDVGWAVGTGGTVWQTLDGAAHWTEVQFNDTFSLSADDTYIVGDGGTIIHWSWNGGSPVAELQYNAAGWTTENLNAIHMFDADNGLAVGENGTAIQFTTGSWGTPVVVGGAVNPDLKDIDLTAADAGYAVGSDSGTGYYVPLAGGAWGAAVQIGAVAHPMLNSISLTAAGEGLAVGEGGYFAPLAGGTWGEPAQVGGTNPDLNGVVATGLDAYAVGDGGYYATYISAAWTVAQVGGDNPDLYSLANPTDNHGYAVGGKAGAGYTVPIVSGEFGLPTGLGTRELRGVSEYDTDGHGFAVGLGRTLASLNVSGSGWSIDAQISSSAGDFNDMRLGGGTARGWAVGAAGMAYEFFGGLFISHNSSTTESINAVTVPTVDTAYAACGNARVLKYNGSWSSSTLTDGNDFLGLDSIGPDYATLVGARNSVWHTGDGSNWTHVGGAVATTDDFASLDFADSGNGWFVGQSGMFYRYANGELRTVAGGTTRDLMSVSMSGPSNGFAAGGGRTVLRTTAPDTWGTISGLSGTSRINGLTFPGAQNGWFAGNGGYLLKYDNGAFIAQVSGVTQDLNDVSLVWNGASEFVGAAVGAGGQVRYTDDSGTTWAAAGGALPAVGLNGIDVVSPTKAILCGDYSTGDVGTVRVSANGGQTWTAPATAPDMVSNHQDLTSVSFGDGSNDDAWTVGTGGVVFTSGDLGNTWAAQTSGVAKDLRSVSAYYDGGSTDYTVVAVGDTRTILRSVNGGVNWLAQSYIAPSGALNAATVADPGAPEPQEYYFAGANASGDEGLVVRTSDGGATFVTGVVAGASSLNGIYAYSTGAVWTVGDGGFVAFNNGGGWAAQDGHTTADLSDVACDFSGANFYGVLVGTDGIIMKSLDASNGDGNWTAPATNPNKNNLSSCTLKYFAGPPVVVHCGGDNGTVLGSADGGDNLQFLKGPANELRGTSFYDSDHGWACGTQGTILRTVDGGSTWTVQNSTVTADLNAVYALDATHAVAVGAGGAVVFWDGALWNAGDAGVPHEDFYGVCAADTTHVWAVGVSGAIRFYDGGSWSSQDTGTEQLNAVTAPDANHAWAVGNTGTVLFFNGSTWGEQESGTTANLYSVSAPDNGNVWAAGASGAVLRSTNGGTAWSALDTGSGANLYGIRMVNDQNGWAVGANELALDEAEVLLTSDGGDTWTPGTSSTGIMRSLKAVSAGYNSVTENWDYYAAGDWGLVQKVGGVTAAPTITPPLSPSSGTVVPSTVVTINGSGFGADQATVDGRVIFNGGTEGTVAPGDWTDTQIDVSVPSGAFGYQQYLRVRTDGGTSNGAPFTVTPSISGATSPVTGGEPVTINGEGFGDDPGATHRADADHHVIIGGSLIPTANVTTWTNTQIVVTMPNDITPGTGIGIQVTAENASNVSNTFDITVNPHVTSLSSDTARPGDVITISGTNFGTVAAGSRNTASDHVSMNTATGSQHIGDNGTLEPSDWTPTAITFTIPYEYLDPSFIPRTGDISVTAATQASNGTPLTMQPKINSLSTTEGTVGQSITINGECFGDPQGAGVVTFNGTEASAYTSWADNRIIATVPDAAVTSGTVKVTIGAQSSNEPVFHLTPELDNLSADSGRAGDHIVLTGTGFGTDQGLGTVSVGGVEWTGVTAWSKDSITVTVPDDGVSGDVVVATEGGQTPPGMNFAVLPKITTINPTKGVPGVTQVTINGFAFGPTQGTGKVEFNGRQAGAAVTWSPTLIRIVVPVGTTSGNVVVTTAEGVSNGVAFTVGPYINSITPGSAPPTGEVTIAGVNFKATQGTSKVEFNGVNAGAAVSWSDTSIKVQVPYGAQTGNVLVTTSEGPSNTFPFTVGLSKVYYFAEGTTRANFETWLCLMNPNDQAANIQVLYMLGDGTTKHFEAAIPKTSRMTLYVADVVGLEKDVSTKVTSDLPIVAERPMYFNYGGVWTGGHDVIGAIAPAQDWYFAEGSTRDGFDEWICLQNPNAQAANVDITYMLQGGQNKVQTIQIPATSRKTISVNGFLGPNQDSSAKVHADIGVIAERPMYFIYKPGVYNWTGGHDVVGANAPGNEWYFAEGTTRDGFDEWLCLQNPGSAQATVNVSYMRETGETKTQIVAVEPHARKTLDVVGFIGRGRDVSMQVTSDQPIVAERPMYFDYVGLTGGSDVIGSTCSAGNWYFAEGATQNGFQEWMSIQNPGDNLATVDITYMLGTGQTIEKTVTVNPHSRTTVDVNGTVGWGQNVSAKVTSMEKVIVERPMYFNQHGWTGGHDVVGFHY